MPASAQLTAPSAPASVRLTAPRAPAAARTVRPVLLVVNPRATGVSGPLAARVRALLERRRGVEAVATTTPGQAASLAREAAGDGYAAVVSLGGDGTHNEVANGLARSRTPLACLPGGRTNVLCRTLGLGEDPLIAAERLFRPGWRRRLRRVDLGTMNGRHFLFACGLGLSARMIRRYDRSPTLKERFGDAYFAVAVASTLAESWAREPSRMRLRVGDRSVEAVAMVVQNSDPLTYLGSRPIRVCEGAGLRTGTISLAVLQRSSARELAAVVPRVASGGPGGVLRLPKVEGFTAVRGARVEAVDGRPLPVEVDGEYVGELGSVTYGVAPRALTLLQPPTR